MFETTGERQINEKQEDRKWARQQLLVAAVSGQKMHTELKIGDTPVKNRLTFEEVRNELYRLMDEGFIKLNPDYTTALTDKGIEELAGNPAERLF